MSALRAYWLALVLVAAAFVVAGCLYGTLPDPVPTHWGLQGRIDGWTPKPYGAFLLPVLSLVLTALMIVLPRVLVRGESRDLQRVYPAFVATLAAAMLYVTLVALLAARGTLLNLPALLCGGLGVLLAGLGLLMRKVPRNRYIGIRTPWTLASDEVWERTHRVAAVAFAIGGLLLLLLAIIRGTALLPLLVILLLTTLVPVGYSYLYWRILVR